VPALAVIAPFGFSFQIDRFLQAWKSVGCTSFQYYRNEQRPPTVAEVLALASQAGMVCDSIHGVFGYHIDPSSPDPDHRRACLDMYRDEGKLAVELGGPMVVVHPACWNPDRREMSRAEVEASSEPRWPRLREFLLALADIGHTQGVTYLIENQPFNCPLGHDVARLAQAVREIQSPRIQMCLDTGHAHITGDIAKAVHDASDLIKYLHIHDNDGKLDDHRMPGDGNLPWEKFAQALRDTKLSCTRMLEVFYDEPRVEALAAGGLADILKRDCAM